MGRQLDIAVERFPIAGRFTIARGSRTEAVVVVVTLTQDAVRGRGECVPYGRYAETVETVQAAIEALRPLIEDGLDREGLRTAMTAGAARNALDCALWDLDAKRTGVPAHVAAGIDRLRPATTAYTISLGTAAEMEEAAAKAAGRPILKIKLGSPDGDLERIAAVRRAAPDATLLADANEGWTPDNVAIHLAALADHGFALVEQPLPAGRDGGLQPVGGVTLCADESFHDPASLGEVAKRYGAVNVKLDKAGGLTEGMRLVEDAERHGLAVMVGCMLGTSLAMAPALLLAGRARFVDLDGPLLLAQDRPDGLLYEGSLVHPPARGLWG